MNIKSVPDKSITNNIEEPQYPLWVKNPNPPFWQSLLSLISVIFSVLIIKVVILILLNYFGVNNLEKVDSNITVLLQLILKIAAGYFGARALKPISTPIWLYIFMLVGAFIPIVCNFTYIYLGKYFIMSRFSFRRLNPSKSN